MFEYLSLEKYGSSRANNYRLSPAQKMGIGTPRIRVLVLQRFAENERRHSEQWRKKEKILSQALRAVFEYYLVDYRRSRVNFQHPFIT